MIPKLLHRDPKTIVGSWNHCTIGCPLYVITKVLHMEPKSVALNWVRVWVNCGVTSRVISYQTQVRCVKVPYNELIEPQAFVLMWQLPVTPCM